MSLLTTVDCEVVRSFCFIHGTLQNNSCVIGAGELMESESLTYPTDPFPGKETIL